MSTELIERFYAAFGRRDGKAMAACYAPEATFRDPVFGDLKGPSRRDVEDADRPRA